MRYVYRRQDSDLQGWSQPLEWGMRLIVTWFFCSSSIGCSNWLRHHRFRWRGRGPTHGGQFAKEALRQGSLESSCHSLAAMPSCFRQQMPNAIFCCFSSLPCFFNCTLPLEELAIASIRTSFWFSKWGSWTAPLPWSSLCCVWKWGLYSARSSNTSKYHLLGMTLSWQSQQWEVQRDWEHI